ncbi:unnamed protein product [Rhizophagus irregularis]|nr:unnamed protein product [Rhizophagus irregularis]
MDSYDEKIEGTTKGLLKFGFKSLAIAGETVKPFLPLFGEALSIVDEIVNIYEDAQYNRKSCITLIDRVENAKTAVKSLSRRKEENEEKFREEGYYLSFTKFVGILKRIKSFVKEVSSLSKFRNVIQASEIREKFKILIEDFDSNVSILKLAMIISNEEQRKKDNEILEGDLAGMTKYLENVEGGLTNVKTGINTVLEEVEILNKKIDKLTSSSIVGKEFIPTEILPIELEEPKQKFTNDNYYKKWSRKLLNDVFCKKIITANEDTLEYKKINAQLAILGRMQESTSIIKFYGLSTVNSEKVMVFEWAEYGNLKEFYEKYEIDWPLKLQIAVNICRGIAFLHGCQILHHDIRCESILITDNIEPKISNFVYSRYDNQQTSNISKVKTNYILNWMAPEKIEQHTHNQKVTIEGKKIYKKYTVRCDIFSFGMLLWELAFQRMPYKNYNQQQIMEYVTAGGREKFDFGLNLTSVQQEFGNVIKAAWQGEPLDRPEIKDLFNILNELSQANEYPRTLSLREIQKNENSCDLANLMPEMPNYTIDILPYEPLIPFKEGCEAHKKGDLQKAWKCFVGHANNGNFHAKYWQGYYLLDGVNGEIDKEKGLNLLRESAEEGIKEAQFRYAFALKDKKPFDKNEFVKYLTLAADNGLDIARFNLGNLYINGKLGFDKDNDTGLRYLRLAAYNRHPDAMAMLNTLKN